MSKSQERNEEQEKVVANAGEASVIEKKNLVMVKMHELG